jgi:soluble lytic murein transglycosylase
MFFSRQRYQKSLLVSGLPLPVLARASVCTLLFMGAAGCADAQRSQPGASGTSTTSPELRTYLNPPGSSTNNPVQVAVAAPSAAQQSGTQTSSEPPPQQPVTAARQALIDAREAVKRKQWSTLERLLPLAKTDPVLGTYADYWSLHRRLNDATTPVPDDDMRRFMQAHPDGYLADRLRGDWLIASTRSGNHAQAVSLWPLENANAQETCSYLLSRHLTGQKVRAADAIDAFQPVSACWEMLDALANDGVLRWSDRQALLRQQLETNRSANIRRMAAIVFDGANMVDFTAIMKDPLRWLKAQKAPRTNAQKELVTMALARLAYGDKREQNAKYIQQHWASLVPKSDLEWVWGHFGLIAALNVEPDAVQWYRKSGNAALTDYNHAWQVRSELRQAPISWDWVAQAIRRMSARQAAEPVWVYWYARALDALGNKKAAMQHYASIADSYEFYGQLATEELGRAITVPARPAPVTPQELDQARANPGLQRAVALFSLGWRPEAVPEWSYALRGMNDRQLLAAAEFAREQHIYDRVVNTSLLTKEQVDFAQRFIAPFEGRVSEKAREVSLDPAWVYGLIRQESRFITDAQSHVGASGLMQLMPTTARWVARKIGMANFQPSQVNDFEVNTILGTRYLSMVLDKLNGSEILATAGYNAGPGRPVQWRSKLQGPVEGAIFAETIPFTETRLYVKNVMSNTTYYAAMFTGKGQSLKQRLGVISPEAGKKVDLP